MATVYDINIKKLDEKAVIPTYGSEYAAGADLYACLDEAITIEPGQTVMVHTGIAWRYLRDLQDLCMREAVWHPRRGLHRPIRLELWMRITEGKSWLHSTITELRHRRLSLRRE